MEVFATRRHLLPERPIFMNTRGFLPVEFEPHEDDVVFQPTPFVDFRSFSPIGNSSIPFFYNNYPPPFGFSRESQYPGSRNEFPDDSFYGGEYGEQVFESTGDPIWDFESGSGLEFGFVPEPRSNLGMNYVSDSGYTCDGIRVYNEFDNGENERDDVEWEGVRERPFSFEIPSHVVTALMTDVHLNSEFEYLEHNSLDRVQQVPPVIFPEQEDYVTEYEEYDTLFDEDSLRTCRPTAKSVLENLPVIMLTKKELEENSKEVVCAVCKDDVVLGEKLMMMPCSHLFHGDCIFPWLKMANTCPVCRYELPTDDMEYERKRSETGGEAEVRYNFELLRFIDGRI